ncbi:hypothetical protein C0992_008300 [Termitomyces sp. T32_za158]|nr:hypothetical protein C0992_008300 [Termitomyces sp. T32_za158]
MPGLNGTPDNHGKPGPPTAPTILAPPTLPHLLPPACDPPLSKTQAPMARPRGLAPPAQLNASNTLEALEPNSDKSPDPMARPRGLAPLAQLNASDTLEAPKPNSDESYDPVLPDDEEALRANRFHGTNKPWIDVPLDVQERRQKDSACILCRERRHFIGECPKCPTMGHAVWTFEGKECEYQFAEDDPAD